MIQYHDREWGVPVHNDRVLFEFLMLEGAQAGLTWQTVLNKRENYRRAFHDFDPAKIARYKIRDVKRLLGDPGIIRNRLKIEATITNAKRFLITQKEFGSFDKYVWEFVGGRPIKHEFSSLGQVPPTSKESQGKRLENSLRVNVNAKSTGLQRDAKGFLTRLCQYKASNHSSEKNRYAY